MIYVYVDICLSKHLMNGYRILILVKMFPSLPFLPHLVSAFGPLLTLKAAIDTLSKVIIKLNRKA